MMWRYKQPGFALRLLGELQKQQQCSLHCDTLLQTEGVSIPAHSCVLSALSPVFYRAFANTPSLPLGQSRLVQLEAVQAQALMKLVGFMYSGEIEGESLNEQQEVIDVAHRLGFSNFMKGKQKQVNRDQYKSRREIGLQTEETGGRKRDAGVQILLEKQKFCQSGTQTDSTEAHFPDTCIASEPELSMDLPDELSDVSECNSISPGAGLAGIDEIVAHSPLNSAGALVSVHAKRQQTQKKKKAEKSLKKHRDTQISLKIKLKRQRSGGLWELVSVQEESTGDGSADGPLMTHSLAQTIKSPVVQQSPSPSLNLETVTLTPPLELITPLPDTPTRPLSQHFCLRTPDPVPLTSSSQIPSLSPGLSQPQESNEHVAKLLKMVTVGLNILPSVTVERTNSMHVQLEQKLQKSQALANSPSHICSLGPNLGAVGSGTTSSTSKQSVQNRVELKTVLNNVFWGGNTYAQSGKQTVSEDSKTQRLKTATSKAAQDDPTPVGKESADQLHVTDKVRSVWQSTYVAQDASSDNWADFNEMRLPRCLSPLASEAGEITGISTQDSLRPLEFSSCLSVSHVNLQPALRYTSSPIQPQALPGKTNQRNLSCTSLHVNALQRSMGGMNSCLFRSKTDHSGNANKWKSEQKMTKMPDFEKMNEAEDNTVHRQMNESVVKGIPTARHCFEALNEPYRKKAKVAGYPNGVDTQTVKAVNPCIVKIKDIKHTDNIDAMSNPVTSEKMDCTKAAKKTTMSILLNSQGNLALSQISQGIKCKGQKACKKDVWDTKQPSSSMVKCGSGRPLEKRACTQALMEDLTESAVVNTSFSNRHDIQLTQMSKECVPRLGQRLPKVQRPLGLVSKPNRSESAVVNTSFSSRHDIQLTQLSKKCVPRHDPSPPKVQRTIGIVQTITKEKDLINEGENKKEPGMKNPLVEKVTLDVNLNREENTQPKRYASLSMKAGFSDKIFHQTGFSVGMAFSQHRLPANHPLGSIFHTTDRKIRTSLPPHLTSKSNTNVMMDNNKDQKKKTCVTERGTNKPDDVLDQSKDKKVDLVNNEQGKSSSRNVNGCLVNGNVREAEISANTGLSIHETVNLNAASHLSTVPPLGDFNNNFGVETNLQHQSTTVLPKNIIEKPKRHEENTESLCEVPASSEPTEVNLLKHKELHLEETGSTRMVNLEGRKVRNKEKEPENTVRSTEDMEIGRMNEYKAGISDTEVDVMDESAQLPTGLDIDVEESQVSVEMDDDEEAVAYEEFSGQQVLTGGEVMAPGEATPKMTSENVHKEASSTHWILEEPDLSSSSVDTLVSSVVFLPDVSSESAEDSSSAEEELVVDDTFDSHGQLYTVIGTQCSTILEQEDETKEEDEDEKEEEEEDKELRRWEEEEEEEVDVTGDESN